MNINPEALDNLPTDWQLTTIIRTSTGHIVRSLAELEGIDPDPYIVAQYGEVWSEEVGPGVVLSVILRGYEVYDEAIGGNDFHWAYHPELYRLAHDRMSLIGDAERFGDMESAYDWLEEHATYR